MRTKWGFIDIGGPTYTIIVGGTSHYFELPYGCGLGKTDKHGKEFAYPPESHAFWKAVDAWQKQGKRLTSGNVCLWEPIAKGKS